MQEQQYDGYEDNQDFQFAGLGKRKNISKAQQIYGVFYDAQQQQSNQIQQKPQQKFNSKNNINNSSYKSKSTQHNKFKVGQTIQTYSADLSVSIPSSNKQVKQWKKQKQSKKDNNKQIDPLDVFQKDQDKQKNQNGFFTLQSFLNQVNKNKFDKYLDQIQEQQQENDSQNNYLQGNFGHHTTLNNKPIGLNQDIKKVLKLKLLNQSDSSEAQQINQNSKSFENYLYGKSNKKKQQTTKKKTKQQQEKQKEFQKGYGKGFKMLAKMGFTNVTKGLGKNQTGILSPVEAVKKEALTLKDVQILNKKKMKKKENINSESQQIEDETSAQKQKNLKQPFESLFNYRSKDSLINNLLLDLKSQYQSVQSKLYFVQKQQESFLKQIQINQNLVIEKKNQLQTLKVEISEISGISQNIEIKNCMKFPHLAIQYKVDLLYLKKYYFKYIESSFNLYEISQTFENDIIQMKKQLVQFYLAKQKQKLKDYNKITGFQTKINDVYHLNLHKNKQSDDAFQITQSKQDIDKIHSFIQIIVQDGIIPKLQNFFEKIRSLKQFTANKKNNKIIDLLESIKHHLSLSSKEKNNNLIDKFLESFIEPLINQYFQKQLKFDEEIRGIIQLKSEQQQKPVFQKPHLIVFPWFNLINPKKINFLSLINKIILRKKPWSIQNDQLYNLIQPWIPFLKKKQKTMLTSFYLVPRLLHQMEQFKLRESSESSRNEQSNNQNIENKKKIAGFKLYSKLISKNISQNIMKNTIMIQIIDTYKQLSKENYNRNKAELSTWLNKWKRQIDSISLHFFQKQLIDKGIQ